MSKIRVALIGVGNCASALVQGVFYYRGIKKDSEMIGLRHPFLGGYRPQDIEFVSAFDVETRKVGKDLSEAIFSPPNQTLKFEDVPFMNVPVLKGPALDGVGKYLKGIIKISESSEVDVVQTLEDANAEIVINLLPSGAIKASQWYAEKALEAGCAFVNVALTFMASDIAWNRRFENAGLPIVGDDLVDQVGATIFHKLILKLLADRGVQITETYQLDVGGGTESLNTQERTTGTKRLVKTESVKSILPYEASVVAEPIGYVGFLDNQRDSYLWLKGLYFGRTPIQLDIKLSTFDGSNAGSVLFDVIRAVKIALNRGIAGSVLSISAYAFKHPPQKVPFETAEKRFEAFIRGRRGS